MPKASERMLGFQLWLNLPAAEKMSEPTYLGITREMIPVVEQGGAKVHVIGGAFNGTQGVKPHHIPATVLDIELAARASLTVPTKADETVFVFLIEGDGLVNGQPLTAKTAALFWRRRRN